MWFFITFFSFWAIFIICDTVLDIKMMKYKYKKVK